MSLVTAKDLREKRARLVNEAKEILEVAGKETRELTTEESAKFDAIHADVEKIAADVQRIERQESLEREMAESAGARSVEKAARPVSEDEAESRKQKHELAFRKWLAGGERELTAEERSIMAEYRAQSVGTTTAGGFLVPEGFSNALEESMLAFGGMREVATVIKTASGQVLPWPTVNDTANKGAILAENAAITEQDFTFAEVQLDAYKYTSKLVKVSIELLQDSAFDLASYLARALGERIARITNEHFTTGTGTAQPNGIVTASSVGKTGAAGQVTTIIYEDLVDLQHSVDPAYRRNAKWMMSDTMLKTIKKLKDSDGRPLWSSGISVKEPDTILGQPYVINQDIAVPAASAKSLIYGALDKYIVRDVLGVTVRRLDERYADNLQVGFFAVTRTDGELLDAGTDPVKHYAHPAA